MDKLEYRIRSFFLKLDQRDYVFSKILNFIYKIINFTKYFNKLKKKEISAGYDFDLNKDGFIQIFPKNEIVNEILLRTNKIINHDDFNKKISGKKDFLKSYSLNVFKNENHLFLKFLFKDDLINKVVGYLGKNITLANVSILYSENKTFEEGRSQNMHMDGDDIKQIKIFLHISDVDEFSGPLTVINKNYSKILFNKVDQNRIFKKKTARVNDGSLEKFSMIDNVNPLVGKKGTINLVDTSNCYHFGSRPGTNPRYILMYQLLSSFSYYLPMGKNHENLILNSEILNKDELTILNKITKYTPVN